LILEEAEYQAFLRGQGEQILGGGVKERGEAVSPFRFFLPLPPRNA